MITNDLCNYWYQKDYENRKRGKKMNITLTLSDSKKTELTGEIFVLYDIATALEMAARRYEEHNMETAARYYDKIAKEINEQLENRKGENK